MTYIAAKVSKESGHARRTTTIELDMVIYWQSMQSHQCHTIVSNF